MKKVLIILSILTSFLILDPSARADDDTDKFNEFGALTMVYGHCILGELQVKGIKSALNINLKKSIQAHFACQAKLKALVDKSSFDADELFNTWSKMFGLAVVYEATTHEAQD